MSARALAALPLACATLLLAAGGAPFLWPLGLAVLVAASIILPWRGSLTTFGALLWMIGGAAVPILWARNAAMEPGLALSAALLFSSIATVRLFFARALFGRNFDRAMVVFTCIAEGIGAKSAAYPVGSVALVASLLVDAGGGVAALRTWRRLPRAAAAVLLLSAALATASALALPALDRATNRRFQALFAGRMARVSFTPHVRLDEPGFIHISDDIVLRLHGGEADYLRGAIFDSFDGAYWSTSLHGGRAQAGVGATGPRTSVESTDASPWLFAPRNARIVGDTPWEEDALGALRPVGRGVTQWAFAPTDAVDPPGDADLTVPPRLAPRLLELALTWTAGATDDRARADALVRHLREDFTYTLDRPATERGRSALLDFLFVHREGHCEFFASAFVVLARVLGIPARLVAGYRVVEHNGFGGYAVVRAKHAHAWAEAYVPDGTPSGTSTFRVFDATPAGVMTLTESRPRGPSAFLDYLRSSIVALYDAAVASPERSVPALGGAVLVALVIRALRNRRRRGDPALADAADGPPAAFVRFEARLAEAGFVRDGAETLESFAARLQAADRAPLSLALLRYARVRYGTREASERDLARALEPGD